MSPEFEIFLAASVLNDGKIVSYRSLGRELKVHSNAAKRMLYEFYSTQKTKNRGSVNATYLLNGVPEAAKNPRVNGHQQDGEDMHMQSSPYISSSVPQQEDQEEAAPSRSIVLADEEDLEAAKAKFKQIHSIHIYSLGPSKVQNLQILSDCNRVISARDANEDPLVFREKYGVIHNARVKRRTGRRPPIEVPTISTETINEGSSSKNRSIDREQMNAVKPFAGPSSSDESTQSKSKAVVAPETKAEGPKNAEKKPASKPSAAKRQPSDIFKSFSRPKTSLKLENTRTSTSASPASITAPSENKSVHEDELMKNASEDEQEGVFMASDSAISRTFKSQSERAEQLRKMMEDEDEVMENTGDDAPQNSQESEPPDNSVSQKEPSPELPVVVGGGPRRGRRKVMKKKTMKDEEGYLVTKEEPAWESFSEDDPPPPKQKTFPPTAMGKAKKSGGKPGQGNIMSFFGKK